MKPISAFEYFFLTTFGKPVEDRKVFKTIRKNKFHSILEIGLGDGTRAEKMIRAAKKYAVSNNLRYTGVDAFEGRKDAGKPLALRDMHKRLCSSGAKIQLVPGDLSSALARIANSHVRTDLIILSAGQTKESLATAWFYFPRMLHAGSKVLIQESAEGPFKILSRLEIERKSDQESGRAAA